jgi:hypothetical protein
MHGLGASWALPLKHKNKKKNVVNPLIGGPRFASANCSSSLTQPGRQPRVCAIIIDPDWESKKVRSTLTALSSFAVVAFAFSLLCFPQQIDPTSGVACDPKLKDLAASREKAQAGDAAAEYQLGLSMLSPMAKAPNAEGVADCPRVVYTPCAIDTATLQS